MITLPPPLTPAQSTLYDALVVAAKEQSQPEAEKVKAARINTELETLCKTRKITREDAEAVVRSRHDRKLQPDDIIEFKDGTVVTVAEIHAEPQKYHGRACADPLEPEEGTSKAKLFANDNGSIIINSFLHGGQQYYLQAVRVE